MSVDWLALVRAVPHAGDCASRFGIGVSHPHLAGYVGRCNCDRDARIARGLEAALYMAAQFGLDGVKFAAFLTPGRLADAARAFEEESKL